jgi:hypothetical protein
MKNFNEDFVPATLNEAIDYLYSELDEKDIKFIKESKTGFSHHGFGTGIRNSWSLWEIGTPFNNDIRKRFGLWGHGDDCSGLISDGLLAKVKGEDVDKALNKAANRYKKHWLRYGIDPATGEKIPNSKEPSSYTFRIDENGDIIDEDEGDDEEGNKKG